MKLFHATYAAHMPSIMEHGLGNSLHMIQNWTFSFDWNNQKKTDCVYLAQSKEEALDFAETTDCDVVSDEVYLSGFVVIEIDSSTLDSTILTKDPNCNLDVPTFLYKDKIDSKLFGRIEYCT